MTVSKKGVLQIFMGLVITLTLVAAMTQNFTPLVTLEEKLYDFRFALRGQLTNSGKVVIAVIDETSIERLGRWPWSRDRLAQLVKSLSDAGAELVVFDIILSEAEKNDRKLGSAIKEAGNVILPVVFDFDRDMPPPANKSLAEAAFLNITDSGKFRKFPPITAKRVILPVSGLMENVMTLGHINMFPDNDGTLRWESLLIEYGGYLYPSLTLQAAAAYLGVPREKITVNATQSILLGKRVIPTDQYGRTLINYYGTNNTFKYIPIADILDNAVKPELLRGKIVLVGATAIGIYDLRVTPLSPAMPGVEKHASVISSILDGKPLRQAPPATDVVIVVICGLIATIASMRFRSLGAAGISAAMLVLALFAGYYMFAFKGVWINLACPSLNILFIFVGITAYNYAVEERFSRRIRAMFSSYVTEKVVAELIKNPDMARLGGDRREITILFSDIRGFTTFSEKHAPEEVVAILNEYLGEMTGVIFKWEGTLDKFIGDAILAFWGAPLKQENHAELAVKCALDMMTKLRELQQKWEAEGKAGLDIGIGINTGEVLVGNIGAEGKKMDYTVIGDHVNLGSRVESLTRKYDAHILITEFTLNRIEEAIKKGTLGHICVDGKERVIVKGKDQPVGIYGISSLEHSTASKFTECEEGKVTRLKEK